MGAAEAREELARLGEDVAELASDAEEAAHLRRLSASARGLAALDAHTVAAPELVAELLAAQCFGVVIRLVEGGQLDAAGRALLAEYAPPANLSKSQRTLAARLVRMRAE